MLQRLRLKDFKSFADETVELAPLTLLVGANASGKSNLLEAVRFLHGRAFHLSLAEVLNGEKSDRKAWPGLRGGSAEAARIGQHSFRLESRWQLGGAEILDYLVECSVNSLEQLAAEKLTLNEEFLFHATPDLDGDLDVQLTEGRRFAFESPLRTSLLNFFAHVGALGNKPTKLVYALWKTLEAAAFLDIQPSYMRNYGKRGAPLEDQGQNFSGALADLCEQAEDRRALISWLTELCAPELEDVDFIEVKELGDVMAVLVEKGGRRITARSLSDGTLRFLGTLLALRTAAPGSLILMEEIGDGLHPTRIRLLVDALEAATRERNLQILATTHSPVVLQWLSDEVLRNTVVCGRVPEHEGTLLRRLGDLPHFEEVVARKGIEELFTTGWLEMAL